MAAFSDGKSGYFRSTFGSRFRSASPVDMPVRLHPAFKRAMRPAL
jgi:hypothetical protein